MYGSLALMCPLFVRVSLSKLWEETLFVVYLFLVDKKSKSVTSTPPLQEPQPSRQQPSKSETKLQN